MEWISVKNKLPDEHIKVLVVCGSSTLIGIIDSNYNWSVFWSDGINNEDYERSITHWMPLPEPPKQ